MTKMEQQKEIGIREVFVQDREIEKSLRGRSGFAVKQQKIVKQLKNLQEEYQDVQKEIERFNKEIIYKVYKKYLAYFAEFEDIYEVKLQGGKVLLRIKDAVEDIKVLAKDKFLTNKLNFLKSQEIEIGQETKDGQGTSA